jgi:hypothetical protein
MKKLSKGFVIRCAVILFVAVVTVQAAEKQKTEQNNVTKTVYRTDLAYELCKVILAGRDVNQVEQILSQGQDPNVYCSYWTPAFSAAYMSTYNINIFQLLLKFGLDINKSYSGRTPIGNKGLLELVKKGYLINIYV